jgi:hypothetical protein
MQIVYVLLVGEYHHFLIVRALLNVSLFVEVVISIGAQRGALIKSEVVCVKSVGWYKYFL